MYCLLHKIYRFFHSVVYKAAQEERACCWLVRLSLHVAFLQPNMEPLSYLLYFATALYSVGLDEWNSFKLSATTLSYL